jgi:iron complex transport system permease protein
MGSRSTAARFGWLAPAAVLVVAASALLGPTPPRWDEIFVPWGEIVSGKLTNPFWHLRVPRTCLAALVGAGLAVGGVIFQALFRNPLAEPYTLGIASGASLGAAIGFLTGIGGHVAWLPTRSLLALGGAAVAMSLVYLMARLRAGTDMTRLLLAGVCVAYSSAAGILLVTFLADRAVTNDIVVWLMGSLGIHRPVASLEVAVLLAAVLAFAIYSHRALDLLWLGDQLAAARGVAVARTVWGCFVLVGLLTAGIVANCGPIGFVGLMVPHIARALFGVRTLPLLVGAALVGAAFLAGCDALGRAALSLVHQRPIGYEFPVGVLTNIVGAGFFFYLLATRDVAPTATR